MEGFVSSIRKNYCDRAINYDEEHWPSNQSGKLMRLKLVIKKKGEHFYAWRLQSVDTKKSAKQIPIPYEKLFKSRKKPVRKVLIEGSAGIGKTSLCISISKDWARGKLFQEYEVLLFLPLHQEMIALAGSLSELMESFKSQVTPQSIASYLEEKKGEGLLIVADGWNKLDESRRQKGSFLYNLLFGGTLDLASVLVTSRHSGSALLHKDPLIDPLFVEIHGFSKKGIREYIEAEFIGNQQATDHLLEQLKYNPQIESICSNPLICSMVCRLCRLEKALPPTMTELCTKLVFNIINTGIQKIDTALSVHEMDELPESLQESWWHLCQLAYQAIHTNQIDCAQLQPARLCFGIEIVALVDYIEDEKCLSLNFLHPTFQEYLASLHLVKQPLEFQLKAMEMIRSKRFAHFWRYLFGHCIKYDQKSVLKHAIQVLSTDAHSRAFLCQCAFEAGTNDVIKDVVKALSPKNSSDIHFGDPHTANDCESIMHVIDNIHCQSLEYDGMIINFSACSLDEKQITKLTDILCKKTKPLQLRNLDMSDNNLSDSCVADLFHRAIAAFQSIEKIFLRNNKIGIKGISAIMAALAQSSSRSVLQLDLSFNPLTITGLQLLQDEIRSGHLVNLEILFLQGSLTADANVNVHYLITLAKVLLTHCPHLRRLDLSDNDLGEPGTPDISTVTSQLIGHDKNLDLRLNREYMAEVDDNFIAIMQESVRRKGTIDHTAVHGVIVGPGRSGKNSLMNRLMGEGPPNPDSISPSTGVLENIVKIEVKKLCTVAAAVKNLIWKRLDYDEEALELMMSTAKSHTASEVVDATSDIFDSQERVSSAIIEIQSMDSIATKPLASAGDILKLDKGSVVHMEDDSDSKEKSISHSSDELEHDRPLDIFKRAVKLRQMDALREHLESSWSLYLTNTGGQTEFQELLPLLVCGPSVFFITFPLDKNLHEHYTVKYQYPDGSEKTYPSPSTLMDEILQTLATIAALDSTGPLLQCSIDLKPKVFFVGTHKDQLPESSRDNTIQTIDQQLQEKVRQTSLFHQGSIEFAVASDQLTFAVNNLDEDDTDFQKIRSALQQAIERCEEFTVQCPSTWLIFSLVLRAKHKSCQILSYQDCFTIAQDCGISDRAELNNALVFIHSRLGLLRYFCVEELNGLVVIDPQILFDTITKLIVETFTSDHAKVNEIEEFQKRGILSMKVMERISSKRHSDSQLPFKWLLNLLNHLRIAAFFIDRNGERKCFFPSVLCHAPLVHKLYQGINLSIKLPPQLLIAFKGGFCPRGIPSALIKYLMTNEMKSEIAWELHSSRVFRNQVSFGIGPCDIILKILPTHLEISFDPESDIEDYSDVMLTCTEAFTQFQQAMAAITVGYRECDYFFAFYCTKPKCQACPHPAEIELGIKKLRCRITERRGPLPQNYNLWMCQNVPQTGQCNTLNALPSLPPPTPIFTKA
jgi:GTPase SAR1 family protein